MSALVFVQLIKSSHAHLIRKKQRVDFGKKFICQRTKALSQMKMWGLLLTNERERKEKSKNSS